MYFANGDINLWITNQFLTALFTFLSTLALGTTVVYIIFISAKLSGFIDKIKNVKDPRRDIG
jgi:predicted membrane protein|tara:strand:- start:744 stop:929 length:186 start_codon:yes stop_codon:yes gene_type:complete